MKWLVCVLLLAGCAEPVADETVMSVPASDATQELVLLGQSSVSKERTVDIMVYHQGRMIDLTDYTAEPDAPEDHIRTFVTDEGKVRVRLIEDNNSILDYSFDPTECESGAMEVTIHLLDDDEEFIFGC